MTRSSPARRLGKSSLLNEIVKTTAAGQLSLPARVRRRWGTSRVAIADEGNQVVVRPVPDDPIKAALGSLVARRRSHRDDQGSRAESSGGGRTATAARVSTVLDAYAVIATLVGEPAGRHVVSHLRQASMCAANVSE